ncbi:hypothetical protein RHMOL_Rhmol03G0161900 [Rhododendron molle]|uniref:Uncharacterized protein n=1 Tax=Rhododendron molle TaxID=49168 RepID=A0ACC0PHA5_RHOML|nr:hypothetical protein RHMOL_Rhmol03G0161900 [Rhododendron molle]
MQEEGIFHSSASLSDGPASIKSFVLGSAIGYKISKKFISIYAEGKSYVAPTKKQWEIQMEFRCFLSQSVTTSF